MSRRKTQARGSEGARRGRPHAGVKVDALPDAKASILFPGGLALSVNNVDPRRLVANGWHVALKDSPEGVQFYVASVIICVDTRKPDIVVPRGQILTPGS